MRAAGVGCKAAPGSSTATVKNRVVVVVCPRGSMKGTKGQRLLARQLMGGRLLGGAAAPPHGATRRQGRTLDGTRVSLSPSTHAGSCQRENALGRRPMAPPRPWWSPLPPVFEVARRLLDLGDGLRRLPLPVFCPPADWAAATSASAPAAAPTTGAVVGCSLVVVGPARVPLRSTSARRPRLARTTLGNTRAPFHVSDILSPGHVLPLSPNLTFLTSGGGAVLRGARSTLVLCRLADLGRALGPLRPQWIPSRTAAAGARS